MKQLFTFFAIILSSQLTYSQDGFPDYNYGDSGKVVSKTYYAPCYAAILQPDGKLLVAGSGYYYDAESVLVSGFSICRYNIDGELDFSFGDSGRSFNNLGEAGFIKTINALAIQADGKIVASGLYGPSGDDGRTAVMRFNTDGSIDRNFGDDGLTVTKLSRTDIPRDMALLPDGRIVVTGNVTNNINDAKRFFVTCYTVNGVADNTFGNNGSVITEVNYSVEINAIAVTEDAKIIAAGRYVNGNYKTILVCFDNKGELIKNFGVTGIAEMSFPKSVYTPVITDIELTTENKIVTAGYADINRKNIGILVSRFTPEGLPDSSFGTNGYTVTEYKDGDAHANAIALQKNGKVLAGGYFTGRNDGSFTVVRYTQNGVVDSSFGENGIQNTRFTGDDIVSAVVVQNDGKIILAGYSFNYEAYKWQTQLVRYYGDESKKQILIAKIRRWLQHHNGIAWDNMPNMNDYAVQRSNNSLNWSTVFRSQLTARGSQPANSYADPSPLPGTNYYRLQTTSVDGAVTNSNVIAITHEPLSISLSPNPAKSVLRIEGLPSNQKIKITVATLNGNVAMNYEPSAISPSCNLNIATLKPGNYLLRLETEGEMITKHFVKE